VQRKTETRPKEVDPTIDPVEVAETMRHEKPEASQVQQVMRQVAAAKPSDSSVELILPRRQRPQMPPRTSPPAVQTQRENNGNGGTPAAPDAPKAFVPTEIGPLPGDLWEILGASVPTTTPTASAAAATTPVSVPTSAPGSSPAPQAAVMRAVAAAESPAPLPTTPSSYPNGNGFHAYSEAIQRAEEASGQSRPTSTATVGSGVPARTASAQEGGTEQGGAGGEQGEVNVDELARQVYVEVKRRLAVEWERGRGRF
jgi:hypothetical protein